MPRQIDVEDDGSCSVEECTAALNASGFDPSSEDSLLHAAGWLRRLGNNRDFLGDMLVDQLKARHRDAGEASAYGPQVVMLSPAKGSFFLFVPYGAPHLPPQAAHLAHAHCPQGF